MRAVGQGRAEAALLWALPASTSAPEVQNWQRGARRSGEEGSSENRDCLDSTFGVLLLLELPSRLSQLTVDRCTNLPTFLT